MDLDNEKEEGGNHWRYPQTFKVNIRKFSRNADNNVIDPDELTKYIEMGTEEAKKDICRHIEFADNLPEYRQWFYKDQRFRTEPYTAPMYEANMMGRNIFGRRSRRSVKPPMNAYLTRKNRPGKNEVIIAPLRKYGSAVQLCESWNSVGPDYANVEEGLFCEIETKTLYPICGSIAGGDDGKSMCFDVERKSLAHGKTAALVPRKETYKKVHMWGKP